LAGNSAAVKGSDLIILLPPKCQKATSSAGWIREIAVLTGVSSDDILKELREIENALSVLLLNGPAEAVRPESVWGLYASSERLAAILKFRLGVERPGYLESLPKSERPEEFLPAALREIREAISLLERKPDGDHSADALRSIRNARTSLRAYLASKRRLEARARRRKKSADAASKTDATAVTSK
jgi:hypothetical protein